jgi:transcription-repair coupling factor (superfamily II helicase)
VHARLILYKRIASATDEEGLKDLQVEMIDRFGLLPEPTKNLVRMTLLKLQAEQLGIKKVDAGPQGGRIEFAARDPGRPAGVDQIDPGPAQPLQVRRRYAVQVHGADGTPGRSASIPCA